MSSKTLWIDDKRPLPEGYTHMAMSSAQAITLLSQHDFDVVSFDHDLGGTYIDDEFGEDTTRPVLTWIIENGKWPREIRFHTANPVGRDWLEGTARRYAPADVLVSDSNPYAGWM